MGAKVRSFTDNLSHYRQQTENKLARIDKELYQLPESNLTLNHKRGKTYFIENSHAGRRGINDDMDHVYLLARKRYLKLLRRQIDSSLKSRGSECRTSGQVAERLDTLLDEYVRADLDISRITLTPSQYKWMHGNYKSNGSYRENLQYLTNSGVRVRSKSERTIADRLSYYAIPYRYESEIEIDVSSLQGIRGTRMGKYKAYHPDFLIKLSSGKHVIWEHLGLIDLEDYRESSFEKLFVYRQVGLVSEQYMITTYEQDLSDTRIIDDIIVRRIIMND